MQLRLRLFTETDKLYGIKFKCSYGVIATMTLNDMHLFSCDKEVALPLACCEQPFTKAAYSSLFLPKKKNYLSFKMSTGNVDRLLALKQCPLTYLSQYV